MSTHNMPSTTATSSTDELLLNVDIAHLLLLTFALIPLNRIEHMETVIILIMTLKLIMIKRRCLVAIFY